MQQVINAAYKHGRKVAFAGMSMRENAKMARKLGYLDLIDDLVIPLEQALKMPPSKVALMCTGSQGEPTSIMGRLAAGTNKQFDLRKDDTVVLSADAIPGNEEAVYRTINRLFQRGANVLYEPITSVHVSGHASQEEIKLMLHLIKPKYLVPMHGELRHLRQHAILAKEVGFPEENIAIVENGQVIEFENGSMQLGERVPGGYVFVDGGTVGDIGPAVMREREVLSRDGFVFISLLFNFETGDLVQEPEIVTRGFVYSRESSELMNSAREQVAEILESSSGNLKKDLEKGMRSFFYKETKRRPMIFVVIHDV
jgi:ribonuclease J